MAGWTATDESDGHHVTWKGVIRAIRFKGDGSALTNIPGGAEVNDLTSAVTWANIPNANVPESAVTQHEAAIDHDALTNFVADEHIAGGSFATSGATHNMLSTKHADSVAAGVSKGSIIIGNGTPKWIEKTVGADGTALMSQADGSVDWENPDHDALTNFAANEHVAATNFATSGAVSASMFGVASSVFATSGAIAELATKGDLATVSGAAFALPVGDNDDVLTADSATPAGIKWAAPAAASVAVSWTDGWMDNTLNLDVWGTSTTNGGTAAIDTTASTLNLNSNTTESAGATVTSDNKFGNDLGSGTNPTESITFKYRLMLDYTNGAARTINIGTTNSGGNYAQLICNSGQTDNKAAFTSGDGGSAETSAEFTFTRNVYYDVEIILTSGSAVCKVDGAVVATNTTNPPTMGADIAATLVVNNENTTTDVEMILDYFNITKTHTE